MFTLAKELYCYTAVYNSPLVAARSFRVSKPLNFFAWAGGPPPIIDHIMIINLQCSITILAHEYIHDVE